MLGLNDEQVGECEAMLRAAAASDELAGSAMVYSLAEQAQGWLRDRNEPEVDMHTAMLARQQASAAACGGGEAECLADAPSGGASGRRKGPEGVGEGSWRADPAAAALGGAFTPVTPESFAAWRAEYDAEQKERALERAAALSKRRGGGGGGGGGGGAVGQTGRQLFESKGAVLVAEDAGDLGEGEEDVMAARREGSDGAASEQEGEGEGELEATLLEAVGDANLFDDDDLDDLPDD